MSEAIAERSDWRRSFLVEVELFFFFGAWHVEKRALLSCSLLFFPGSTTTPA